MNSGDLNKVWEIRALKRKPKQEEARKILEKIAAQVQPIMRKHKWRVKLLSEMWFVIIVMVIVFLISFCFFIALLFGSVGKTQKGGKFLKGSM